MSEGLLPAGRLERIKEKISANKLFLFVVIIPTTLAICYWGFIASDIYVSESSFIIRGQQQTMSGNGFGAVLAGMLSQTGGDPYAVRDFILSRDAARQLEEKLQFSKLYSGKNIDFVNRFDGPLSSSGNDFEALYRYYKGKIAVDIDSSSNIGTLSVEAFSPGDAYKINKRLLEMSERLVNWLNERSQQDTIQFAEGEVSKAEDRARNAELVLAGYRNKHNVFNPEIQSGIQMKEISKLQEDLISAKNRLVQIRSVSADNPQISTLQTEIDALRAEIRAETNQVAGGRQSLSEKSAGYENVVLERDFAEKELSAALAFLDQARYQAQHQQLYLELIVQPNKPDAPKPRRLRDIVATFIIGLIVWGIASMMIAGVREHMEK